MRFGRVNDVRKFFNLALKARILGNCVLPDLVGIGSKIDVVVRGVVEHAGAFVVEVDDNGFVIIFEECLVGADDFSVLKKTRADAGTQENKAFDAFCGQEGVAEDLLGFLTDAVNPSGALHEANNRPGQVVVHDDGAVLQILALAQDIGADENAQLIA